jgi:molybdenum cofactor biosynthesis enzyme MoaA
MTQSTTIQKNYNKSNYSFANINFLGKCNADCYFCLGKDLEQEFSHYNDLHTPVHELRNLESFLQLCKEQSVKNIYITGQNTDSLLYRHLNELICHLQDEWGFRAGLRTNALLAKSKIETINRCDKSISYTILTQRPEIMQKLTGTRVIPDFDYIFNHVTIPQRVATVVTQHNADEILDLIRFVSKYPQVQYFQVRRVSTDTRFEQLKDDIAAFDALLENVIRPHFLQTGEFELAPLFDIHGVEVSFWKTVETTANSLNYFSNGVISDEYFIIEGYNKHRDDFLTSAKKGDLHAK